MTNVKATVEYRDIPGHHGYRVGNDGSVWSCLKRKSLGGRRGTVSVIGDAWRRLKADNLSAGYPCVRVRSRTIRVHSLVLLAFVGPCPDGMECLHNDGNRLNCTLLNLRWGTHAENMDDRNRHDTHNKGERNGMHRYSEELVAAVRSRHTSLKGHGRIAPKGTIDKLAAEFKLTTKQVEYIVSDQAWGHL